MVQRLAYLYLGVADTARAATFYRDALGGEIVWAFDRFGAIVAAVWLGEGPLLLLADHRPVGECRPLDAVDDLHEALVAARAAGARHVMEVGVPPGPCAVYDDVDGSPLGVIEETRPSRMEEAFRNPENSAALRPPWPDRA